MTPTVERNSFRYSESPLVTCRDLLCRLGGRVVLDGLSLELQPRESLALLGGSGSGKSTLLRIIAGLEVPERGEVLIAGQPATRSGRLLIPPHGRQLSMLFQDLALWPNLTVMNNVLLGLASLRLPRQQARDRATDALGICGIEDLVDRLPGTLSGGQQQRVALARALAMRPQLLLLDEPFGGLDLLTRETIVREVAKLREALGFALILVTHDPAEVQVLCDSLAVLENGHLTDRGLLRDVRTCPSSALAQAFISQLHSTPRSDPRSKANPSP